MSEAIVLDGITINSQDVKFSSAGLLDDYSPSGYESPFVQLIVAASNSSTHDKALADYVCDGVDDAYEINLAIDRVKTRLGTVVLCDGDYYIDRFTDFTVAGHTEKAAIKVIKPEYTVSGVSLVGCARREPKAIIHVLEQAFTGLSANDQPSVISGGSPLTDYVGEIGFDVKNIKITFPNTHKLIAINYQHSYWGMTHAVIIEADNYGQDVVPVEGCIGIRGWAGWSDGTIIGLTDTYVCGCYVAFQLGGEHVICERCGARFNYYSYTFGEYEFGANSGAQVHPITMINCCDEHQAALPKFCTSGFSDDRGDGRCAVDFISFNIELYPLITGVPVIGATEDTDGGWVGRIDYTIENNEAYNRDDLYFWAEGHGKNFRSTNSSHKQFGPTSLRNTFAPNYMQQFYDETLNKVVFCKDPHNKVWIDANGTVV